MCTPECFRFAEDSLTPNEILGKAILEVGARDFNGSLRQFVEGQAPASYIAVDMIPGPGVDIVCTAEKLIERFGRDSFDVVISTEMIEHVHDWRTVISNLKQVVRPGGVLLLTTRSPGFPFHGYPGDFWRYKVEDIRTIFSDTTIERLETDDPTSPGVFLKARKPIQFFEADLSQYRLYSIIRRRRIIRASALDVLSMTVAASAWKAAKIILPRSLVDGIRRRAWHTQDVTPTGEK